VTNLGLDNSSDQVKYEVDNHNNCATKSKESLKLNKSGKGQKEERCFKKWNWDKGMLICIYWQYYVGSHSY
jgi:hypothetical protein